MKITTKRIGRKYRIRPSLGFRSQVSYEILNRGLVVSVRRWFGIIPHWEVIDVVQTIEQAHALIKYWDEVHTVDMEAVAP